MNREIDEYIIFENDIVLNVLKKIDKNNKGFLIVINENKEIQGTMTDGDVRRFFLKGGTVNQPIIGIFNKEFTFLTERNSIKDAIDLFKSNKINFLPIIDDEKHLKNIITKRQMHALLLQDLHADLSFDFFSLDEMINEYEIFQRPWGYYKTTVLNDYFQSKIISINPGGKLSLQSHNRREEHWIVAHGTGVVQIGESMIEVTCGSSLFIPKGCKHRITNTSETESLIVTEVQIGDYFGEDDIIRYEDIYGRV